MTDRKEEPGYYAIIPANVRYNKQIPANAKLLYGEISSLCNKKGYCWAGNAYFAELYEASDRTIAAWISALKNAGYISISYSYKPGKKEIASRYIRLADAGVKSFIPENNPTSSLYVPPNTFIAAEAEAELPDRETCRGSLSHIQTSRSEVVKNSSPRSEKNFTTYGGNLQEVVKKFSEGGEENFRDNIKYINNKAAAADQSKPEKKKMTEAAAGLKKYIKQISNALIFDEAFYRKALAFMDFYNLDSRYASWLYEFCKIRKADNIAGYYFKVFFEPRYVEIFREKLKPPEVKTIKCPVCGMDHGIGGGKCPHCGLEAAALYDQETIKREKKLYSMSPETRKAYETEMDNLIKDGLFQNLEEKINQMKRLRLKYGL